MFICHIRLKLVLAFILIRPLYDLSAQAPPTSQELLSQRGIAFTTPALRSALKNPDPDVRGIAAGVLAERMDVDAIPLITEALNQESIPRVKINLAAALSTLDKHRGDADLLRMCSDRSINAANRLMAANRLLDVGNESCTSQVLSVANDDLDPSGRQLALQYLRRITNAPVVQLQELRIFLLKELHDSAPQNRQYASECLSVFGNRDDMRELQNAIGAEQDRATRVHLEENLGRMKARLK